MGKLIRPKDAVFQALRFEQPAVCPYYIWVDKAMVPVLAERYGADQFVGPADGTRTFDKHLRAEAELRAGFVHDGRDQHAADTALGQPGGRPPRGASVPGEDGRRRRVRDGAGQADPAWGAGGKRGGLDRLVHGSEMKERI